MFLSTPPRPLMPQPTVEDVKRDAAAQLSALLAPLSSGRLPYRRNTTSRDYTEEN